MCVTTFGDVNVRSAMDSIVKGAEPALQQQNRAMCTPITFNGMHNHDHVPSSTDSEGFLSRLEGTATLYTRQLRVLTQCL